MIIKLSRQHPADQGKKTGKRKPAKKKENKPARHRLR